MSRDGEAMRLDEHLCYGIYSAGMAIQRAYKPVLDSLGLTYPQYLVMNSLWREDAQTVGRLAERLALEPSTLTPLLKRLERAGLVARERDTQDQRQVFVRLTSGGASLEPRARCLADRMLETSGLTPERLAELNREVTDLRERIYGSIGDWQPAQG